MTTPTSSVSLQRPPFTSPQFIYGAGGLLWRREDGRRLLAVVHRPIYGDWSLPKGKLEPGETWERAAQREVSEETGCESVLGEFAGAISYTTPAPKLVLFWQMETSNRGRMTEEVDEIRWLPPEAAIDLLTYQDQRDLVWRAVLGQPRWNVNLNLKATRDERRVKRLDGALLSLGPLLDRAVQEDAIRHEVSPVWVAAARELQGRALESLRRGQIDQGWGCFQATNRAMILGFGEAQLDAACGALRQEAVSKLDNWRGKAISELLDKDRWRNARVEEKRAYLYEAQSLRDEHAQNQYFKLSLLGQQIQSLVVALAVSLIALGGVVLGRQVGGVPVELAARPPALSFPDLLTVGALGAVGGAFSGLLRLIRDRSALRIPELFSVALITAMRPLTGIAGAIAAVALLYAGLIRPDLVNGAGLLVIAFAGGFTERLVTGAIERVAARET